MLKLNREAFNNAMAKNLFNATDLAKKAEISDATLSRMLKNNAVYSLKTLGKIANALNIKEPADLIQDWYKQLLKGGESVNSLTKEEEIFLVELIEKFKKLPTDKKQYILGRLEEKTKQKEAAKA